MTHVIAKIFGWMQFVVSIAPQIVTGAPHGWTSWVAMISSFAAAVAIHAASNTDGTK